ncbi:MAG: hypothetical protein BGO86_05880 [Chryseobacterium sp. 36-9]|nr:MAG: hypothetical protein BGO86_05880 [Chryseobacterium sp. 36-9]
MVFFLLIIIVLLIIVIIKPLFKKKFQKVKTIKYNNILDLKESLTKAALEMLYSTKSFMSFYEEDNLYTDLAKLKTKLKGDKKFQDYTYYNFPKAFLMIGILDLSSHEDFYEDVDKILKEKYVDSSGNLKFLFDKIDQSLFGVVFIKMFDLTKNNIYRIAADRIYQEIQNFKNEKDIYLYRKNSDVLFIDTLGMIVPFLTEYSKISNNILIQKEAHDQLSYYIKLTTCNNEFPCHAFDLNNNLKLGSNNWSRGIAWLMIGVAYAGKNNVDLKDTFDQYYSKLLDLRIDNYWPQFFSHSDDNSIDASATLMLYYSASVMGIDVKKELNIALKNSIDTGFFVENNSGDTIYINKYSKIKGRSEVSQGLLLSIISN